jgi:hypothetical protein
MMYKTLALTVGAITIAAVSAIAAIGSGYTLFGGATFVSPGNASSRAVQLVADVSNASTVDDFSGIDFGVTSGLTFADLNTLSADYNFTAGSCAGGSPRFQVNVLDPNTNTVKNIQVYIGPAPSYTGCPPNVWTNTGNLLAPANLIDTSQLTGGTFYDTVTAAETKYGSYQVVGIQLVADTFGAAQTVLIDNVVINSQTTTFEPVSKDDCKNGGWKNFTSDPGPFKNQGQCVSHFASDGHGNH